MHTALARTLPRTLMTGALALAATLASFALTVDPAQAAQAGQAAQRGGGYSVTLATPLAEARREIIDGAMWRCEGDRCAAPADGERVQALCGKVSRKFGPVARFASPKGELVAEDLARCNNAAA